METTANLALTSIYFQKAPNLLHKKFLRNYALKYFGHLLENSVAAVDLCFIFFQIKNKGFALWENFARKYFF